MSFWFIPSRTEPNDDCEPDLHSTDVEVFQEFALHTWANGAPTVYDTALTGCQWGTKSDARALSALLGSDFKRWINEWAPPRTVESWGERLQEMSYHFAYPKLWDGRQSWSYPVAYDSGAYWFRYGAFLIALGQRGIGIYPSW